MKVFKYLLGFIGSISLFFVLLFTTVEIFTFDVDFFMEEANKTNVREMTNLNEVQLEKLYEKLLLYLKGEESNLNITIDRNDSITEAFNIKEKIHMGDVLQLFNYGFLIRNVSASIFVILLCISILFKDTKKYYAKSGLITFSIIGIILIVLLSLLTFDFHKYFTIFHKIFFTKNNYWLLNPKTDLLINLLPQKIFFDIATKIIVVFIIELIICLIVFYLIKKRSNI